MSHTPQEICEKQGGEYNQSQSICRVHNGGLTCPYKWNPRKGPCAHEMKLHGHHNMKKVCTRHAGGFDKDYKTSKLCAFERTVFNYYEYHR